MFYRISPSRPGHSLITCRIITTFLNRILNYKALLLQRFFLYPVLGLSKVLAQNVSTRFCISGCRLYLHSVALLIGTAMAFWHRSELLAPTEHAMALFWWNRAITRDLSISNRLVNKDIHILQSLPELLCALIPIPCAVEHGSSLFSIGFLA